MFTIKKPGMNMKDDWEAAQKPAITEEQFVVHDEELHGTPQFTVGKDDGCPQQNAPRFA